MSNPEAMNELCEIVRGYIPLIQSYQRTAQRLHIANGLSFLLGDMLKFLKAPDWQHGVTLSLRINDELEIVRRDLDAKFPVQIAGLCELYPPDDRTVVIA